MIEEEGSGVDEVAEQEELEYVDEFLMNNVSTLDYELFKKTDQVDSFLRKVGFGQLEIFSHDPLLQELNSIYHSNAASSTTKILLETSPSSQPTVHLNNSGKNNCDVAPAAYEESYLDTTSQSNIDINDSLTDEESDKEVSTSLIIIFVVSLSLILSCVLIVVFLRKRTFNRFRKGMF